MINKKTLLLVIILAFSSCTVMQDKASMLTDFESVHMDGAERKEFTPAITSDEFQGPQIEIVSSRKDKAKKIPIIYVALGSGLFRVSGYVPILSQLQKKKIRVHYLTGEGMGLIVAAMYASGMTLARVEWSLYRLFDQIAAYQPYSSKWLRVMENNIRTIFGSNNLEDFDITLLIPLIDEKSDGVTFLSRGPVAEVLIKSLHETKELSSKHLGYNVAPEVKNNVDIGISMSSLKDFESKDALKTSLFSNLEERSIYREKTSMLIIDLPIEKMVFSTREGLPAYLRLCSLLAREARQRVMLAIEDWKEID